MIVIKLKGGLGNQLFQYALGRALEKNGVEIKYDISSFEGYRHNYILNCFNTKVQIITQTEKTKVDKLFKQNRRRFGGKRGLIYKVFRKVFSYIENFSYIYKPTIHEHSFFDKRILLLKGNHILDGYWARTQYFEQLRSILIKELSLKKEMENPDYLKWLKIIKKSKNSVSIHIRRGDYLDDVNKKIFAKLELSYYKNAIRTLEQRLGKIKLFIFSNDKKWVKSAFCSYDNIHIVDDKSFIDVHDFSLMKACDHNIIANSTFSWWAAYLNDNPNKIVIAPKKWYADEKRQKQYEKGLLIPIDCIKL